jgi:hypothetical protein
MDDFEEDCEKMYERVCRGQVTLDEFTAWVSDHCADSMGVGLDLLFDSRDERQLN